MEHHKHLEARRKLRNIPTIQTFDNLLECCTLSAEDKTILKLHYVEDKDFRYIGDMLGYSESTIKRRHKRALKKLMGLL